MVQEDAMAANARAQQAAGGQPTGIDSPTRLFFAGNGWRIHIFGSFEIYDHN